MPFYLSITPDSQFHSLLISLISGIRMNLSLFRNPVEVYSTLVLSSRCTHSLFSGVRYSQPAVPPSSFSSLSTVDRRVLVSTPSLSPLPSTRRRERISYQLLTLSQLFVREYRGGLRGIRKSLGVSEQGKTCLERGSTFTR